MIMEIDDYNKTIIVINWLFFAILVSKNGNNNKQKWQVLIISFVYSN
jgi:hypothetical protein